MEPVARLDDLWKGLTRAHLLNGLTQPWIDGLDSLKRLELQIAPVRTGTRIFGRLFRNGSEIPSALNIFQETSRLGLRLLR